MCLILFAINKHPKYALVVAANRDEFYARPTADAHFWPDHPNVLAGRDLEANGSWMGVSTEGKISMLTNYRDLSNIKTNAPSRGDIVADFLKKNVQEEQYLKGLDKKADLYNGYNLLFGSRNKLMYYSNVSENFEELTKGIFGLSNHLLNSKWPKIERGKEKLKEIVLGNEPIKPELLFEALYDDIKAPDHQLPDTGVGLEKERMLSPMFIKSADYGSRCSTVVLADHEGNWHFYERVYSPKDFSYRTNEFTFKEKN
ncbi:MAG: NRDE family protein [Candidatus Cyclobacteriaceae bacterium M2_1C_046]